MILPRYDWNVETITTEPQKRDSASGQEDENMDGTPLPSTPSLTAVVADTKPYRKLRLRTTITGVSVLQRQYGWARGGGGGRPYATSRLPTKDSTANIVPTTIQFTLDVSKKNDHAPAPAFASYKWGLTDSSRSSDPPVPPTKQIHGTAYCKDTEPSLSVDSQPCITLSTNKTRYKGWANIWNISLHFQRWQRVAAYEKNHASNRFWSTKKAE